MRRHTMKRMLATAIAFTMAVSTFGYTVTTAAETADSGYVTISATNSYSYVSLSNDDSASNTYTAIEGNEDNAYNVIENDGSGDEYSEVTFPDVDLDNLLTLTPEVDVNEDGYGVVVHPEVPDEEIEIVFPDHDDVFTFTPEVAPDGSGTVVHPVEPGVTVLEKPALLLPAIAPFNAAPAGIRITRQGDAPVATGMNVPFSVFFTDEFGNTISNAVFTPTEDYESSLIVTVTSYPQAGDFFVQPQTSFNVFSVFTSNVPQAQFVREVTVHVYNPYHGLEAYVTFNVTEINPPASIGLVGNNSNRYEPGGSATFDLAYFDVEGTRFGGSLLYHGDVEITFTSPNADDRYTAFRSPQGGISAISVNIANAQVDRDITLRVRHLVHDFEAYVVMNIESQTIMDISVIEVDGTWCDVGDYWSFAAFDLIFWEINRQTEAIVGRIFPEDISVSIELDGQPGVNIGTLGFDPNDSDRLRFTLTDEARGYIIISAFRISNPGFAGTTYVYRGGPQTGGGDNNQGGGGNQPGDGGNQPGDGGNQPGDGGNQPGGGGNQPGGQEPPQNQPPQGGGNYGGSDSGNDSSNESTTTPSTPSEPTTTVRLPVNEDGVSLTVRVTGTEAVLSLPTSTLNTIIDNAEEGIVTLDFSSLEDVETVAIPRAAMRRFANEGLGLDIIMPQGTIAFSAEAVYEIGQLARHSRISIEIVEIYDELEVSIISGRNVITDLEGEIIVIQPEGDDLEDDGEVA